MASQYEQARENFEWDQAWDAFDGSEEGWYNMGHEAIGKHADSDEVAVRIFDFETDGVQEVIFSSLHDLACRFANFLADLGLSDGDRVAGMMEPRPELYATFLGTFLSGNTFVPLYTLFGPEAANFRLDNSETRVLVTTPEHREKISEDDLNDLEEVVEVGSDNPEATTYDDVRVHGPDFETADTRADDTAILMYTSGTTGDPKGVMIRHSHSVSIYPYMQYAVDLRPDDEYFSATTPAWSYGLTASAVYSLHLGCGLSTFRGGFDPAKLADSLETYGTTNLFAPPTALRQLAQSDVALAERDFDLRRIATAGESLAPSTFEWAEESLGAPIRDHYGLTEAGMLVNNYAFDDWEVKPGSMGKPTPGYEVEVLDLEEDVPVEQGETGEIATRQGVYPPLTQEYFKRPEQTEETFGGEWLRTDDMAHVDGDGYFWYEGRADDVIISSGYKIGPTEVENSLLKHDAVAEVAAVGLPDDERGEVVTGFIVTTEAAEPTPELAEEIQQDVKQRLSKHEYPRRIEFVDELYKTASGKVQRYRLRKDHK